MCVDGVWFVSWLIGSLVVGERANVLALSSEGYAHSEHSDVALNLSDCRDGALLFPLLSRLLLTNWVTAFPSGL